MALAQDSWAGEPGVPVAGLVGLGLLVGTCLFGGAIAIRKHK